MPDLDWLQWPAMAFTLGAAWCVASTRRPRREAGFWLFLVSNVLWVAWGWVDAAYAVIVMQVALAALNVRGAYKQSPDSVSETPR